MKTVIKNPNWWRKRTTLKRCRELNSVFARLALLSLVSGLAAELQAGPAPKQRDICYSAECLRTALTILEKMDTKKDPCDDFYQYACGGFINKTKLIDGKPDVTTLLEQSYKVQEQLEIVIKEPRTETDPNYLKLPHALYQACTNTHLIEALGAEPIKHIAKRLGGWPLLDCDCWDSDNTWTWEATVKKFKQEGLGFNPIVGFSIELDIGNPTRRIITLDQCVLNFPSLILPSELTERLIPVYLEYKIEMAVQFGADKDRARRELKKTLQFELDLAKISLPFKKRIRSKDLYNLLTIKQMQKDYSYIDWPEYINSFLPDGQTVKEDEEINVRVLSFFEELGKLLRRTDKIVIANYLMECIFYYSTDFLSEEFRKRKLQFKETVGLGRLKQEPRSKTCVRTVLDSLPISVDSLYVRKYFRQDSKTAVLKMANNIRNAFSRILNETQWMDNNAKLRANEKLKLLTDDIGYPGILLDDKKLEEYHRKLHINPDKYFVSFLRKNVFDTDELFNELRLPVHASDWKQYYRPAMVNAFYSVDLNAIHFPAGILQDLFFNIRRQNYMNYGAAGAVIGHEIAHGFIADGSLHDGYGKPVDWWQKTTRKQYVEKAQCVIDQFDNFYRAKQSRLKVTGKSTLVENIADIAGFKASYLAYKQWVDQTREEQKLPGLSYTSEQMFWIYSAQRFCAKLKEAGSSIKSAFHPPDEFRVFGPLSNIKDFSRDFQCSVGTRMNPVKKCEVW